MTVDSSKSKEHGDIRRTNAINKKEELFYLKQTVNGSDTLYRQLYRQAQTCIVIINIAISKGILNL